MSKLTRKDIENQLNAATQAFRSKLYDGVVPDRIIELYTKALFIVPPIVHQARPVAMKNILSKKVGELAFMEVGIAINVIQAAPLDRIYDSLDEALEVMEEFEVLKMEYNKQTDEFEKAKARQEQKLMEIAGLATPASAVQLLQRPKMQKA